MTRSDTIVILSMIALLFFVYYSYWSFNNDQNQDNNYAQISITGSPQQQFSLHQNKTYTISGRVGNTVIQIKNKKIRFVNSPCTKKYCIHSGWLKRAGSIAACIPNGVSINIKSTKNLFDAINF